jgi:exportin-T
MMSALDTAWIDISLIVTPSFLPVLFECLTLPYTSVKLASADLMYELVTKGMPASDKLELLRILNASEAITQLLDSDDSRRASSSSNQQTNGNHRDNDDQPSELFREKLARLLNGMGLELTKIVDEASASDEQKEAAKSGALALRPLGLRFLADEYDDTSATVIPFFSSIMGIYKKEKKRTPQNQSHMTEEKTAFLNRLLEVTIGKMRFSSEEEWGADDDDEDGDDEEVMAFAEFRKNLKTLFDAIAWIDFGLFSGDIKNMLFTTLDSIDAGSGNLAWNDVELVLHVLYLYGEPAQKGQAGRYAFQLAVLN